MGNHRLGEKDLDGAIAQVEEAIQLDPSSARSYTMLGAFENREGRPRGGREGVQAGHRPRPEVGPSAHLMLGQFLAGQERRQAEAESYVQEGLRNRPQVIAGQPGPRRLLHGVQPRRRGGAVPEDRSPRTPRSQGAAAGARRLLRDDAAAGRRGGAADQGGGEQGQRSSTAKIRLAGDRVRPEEDGGGAQDIDEVLAKEPKNTRALLVKARFLVEEKKIDEAIAQAKAAVAAEPAVGARLTTSSARLYSAKNNSDEAIKAFYGSAEAESARRAGAAAAGAAADGEATTVARRRAAAGRAGGLQRSPTTRSRGWCWCGR